MLKYTNHDIVFQEFPDEVTLAINLSLCPNRCPGCHSAWLQDDVGQELDAATLRSLTAHYAGAITCVALMGGDNDPATTASTTPQAACSTSRHACSDACPDFYCLFQ